MKYVVTTIDGQNLNARHFEKMPKDEAIKSIMADGITKDAGWASKAYDQMHLDIKKSDADEAEAAKKEAIRLEAASKL